MKLKISHALFLALILGFVVSCVPVETVFDESLLIGRWDSGTENFRYKSDGTVVIWDESKKETEGTGLVFNWSLDQAELTYFRKDEDTGALTTIVYHVAKLTSTVLEYKDTSGNLHKLTKAKFDDNLLIGKWNSGTVFFRYDTGGSGVTWDTADDLTEAEGQVFTWVVDESDFIHIYQMEVGTGQITKIYTVTKLTSTMLEYKDVTSGDVYSFTKVQ